MRHTILGLTLLGGLIACNGQGEGEIDPDRPERACADGVDNDQDGLTDCADDDCAGDCEGSGDPEVCDDGSDNDGDGLADCEDSDCSDECLETCDDGEDNDADGLVDCDDDECADVTPCWWPESIQHDGDFAFVSVPFDCFGTQQADDCADAYTSTLTELDGAGCPDCDVTYTGTFNWNSTSCNETYGNGTPPNSGQFGFVFANPDKWVLFAKNDSGTWAEAAVMDRNGQGFQLKRSDQVDYDTGICGDQYVGDLKTTLTFKE